MKYECEECGTKIVVVRRIKKGGRHKGKLRVFADKDHTLCQRCHNSEWQKNKRNEGKISN